MSTARNLPVSDANTENVNTPNPSSSTSGIFSYLLSKHFITILLLGQFLAFCMTTTIVTNTVLAERLHVNFPTTLSLLTYIALFLIYTPITIYKKGFGGWFNMLKNRWWKYLLLSLADVEGNYFIVKAYQYTSILSIMLLDAWVVPCVVVLSIIFLKISFHWSQYLGVIICLTGIAAVVCGDLITKQDIHSASNLALGDIFCLISSTCYAISNVLEEFFVERRPLYEVVGQLGLWGSIISAIQLSILERTELTDTVWTGQIVGMIIAYTIAMIFFYTGTPMLFRLSSATFFNISLLTSDFYTLVFSIYLFEKPNHYLYGIAFVGTMLGIIVYNIYPAVKPKVDGEIVRKDNEAANLTLLMIRT